MLLHRRACAAAALPAIAQTAPVARNRAAGRARAGRARDQPGRIVLELDRGRAPVTAANFLDYVDGQPIRRPELLPRDEDGRRRPDPGRDAQRCAQALPADRARADQPDRTQEYRLARSSIANAGPGTARSRLLHPARRHSGVRRRRAGGDADGFAAFGQVVEGMDVVRKIFDSPVSATKGEGVMKGQMLEPEVRIVKAARVK